MIVIRVLVGDEEHEVGQVFGPIGQLDRELIARLVEDWAHNYQYPLEED